MKIYFFLLAILFLSTTVTRLLLLAISGEPALTVKILADIAFFAICLLACHGLAFGRRYFTASFWVWPGRLTLILGGVHVLLALSTLDESRVGVGKFSRLANTLPNSEHGSVLNSSKCVDHRLAPLEGLNPAERTV